MTASRPLPQPGLRGAVVHVGRSDPCEVIAVGGGRVTVVLHRDGSELVFTLNRLTAHWVQEGEPYFGPRLMLSRDG